MTNTRACVHAILLALCVTFSARAQTVASATPGRSADAGELARIKTDLQHNYEQYIAGFAHSDAAAVAAMYDQRGARLNPHGELVRGRAAITQDLAAFIKQTGPV